MALELRGFGLCSDVRGLCLRKGCLRLGSDGHLFKHDQNGIDCEHNQAQVVREIVLSCEREKRQLYIVALAGHVDRYQFFRLRKDLSDEVCHLDFEFARRVQVCEGLKLLDEAGCEEVALD